MGRMYVRINYKPLEAVNCFKHLRSQVAEDRGCERGVEHRMNEGYKAWASLKRMLSNIEDCDVPE